jgi:hypothetical protein
MLPAEYVSEIDRRLRGMCAISFDVVEGISNGSKHCGNDRGDFRFDPGAEQVIPATGYGVGGGYALMLCYLRYPGRALRAGERPPAALLAFVAEQIGVLADSIDEYLVTKRNCWRHAIECQGQLGLRPFSKKAAAELTGCLSPQAIENDRLAYLAPLTIETCRQRRIVVPSPAAIERFCAELRRVARRKVHRRLTEGLSAETPSRSATSFMDKTRNAVILCRFGARQKAGR